MVRRRSNKNFTPFANVSAPSAAGLTRTVAKTWTLLYPDNETAVNELWDQHTSYDTGVLALEDNYAKAMGLPRGQRWPWDSNRGIYLLNAYHNLHCVVSSMHFKIIGVNKILI